MDVKRCSAARGLTSCKVVFPAVDVIGSAGGKRKGWHKSRHWLVGPILRVADNAVRSTNGDVELNPSVLKTGGFTFSSKLHT